MDFRNACHGCASRGLTRKHATLILIISLVYGQTNPAPPPTSAPITIEPSGTLSSTRFSAPSTYSVPPFSTDPPDNPGPQPDNDNGFDAANYYYAFIAIAVFVLCIIIFLWNMRRRRSKMRSRVRSQSALRQDLENWQDGQRRWLHGMHWRENPALTRYQQGRRRQREEGLNERGEAPPPYNPDAADTNSHNDHRWGTGTDGSGNQITMPLQTLSRDGTTLKPPDYSETVAPVRLDVDGADDTSHTPTALVRESPVADPEPAAHIPEHNPASNSRRNNDL